MSSRTIANASHAAESLQKIAGKNFLSRVVMKYVPEAKLQDLMLVDTPGMIDTLQNRDYDFMQAIKWFTNRADLILFFFDPEKPGTTGESLRVFTEVHFCFLFQFHIN